MIKCIAKDIRGLRIIHAADTWDNNGKNLINK